MLKLSKTECMGCQQCAVTCPRQAIRYIVDAGFLYPEIDENKCVSCGLCEKKCPALNEYIANTMRPTVYAAWTKNDAQRIQSTSGGICFELSKYIIDNGGKVTGVVWTEDYKNAHYEIISDYDGLKRLSQSKYFQPVVGSIYDDVKKCLDNNELVLFIGAACCCEALRLYLGKEYPNLILCDFICRGYTSQVFHQRRIEDLEKKNNSKISYVQYKNKKEGWNDFGTFFRFENGNEYFVGRNEDPYEILFMVDDYNTRPSCYCCRYRTAVRKTDITVGDFWGIKRINPKELKKGVSAVLLNSSKGKELFASIKDEIVSEKRDIVEVEADNGALRKSYEQRKGAENFFNDLEYLPMDNIYRKYATRKGQSKMRRVCRKIRDVLKCNIYLFIKYNFFCSSVKRERGKYIVPYKGTRIKLDKNAKIYIKDNLFLNTLKHGRTKEEMFFSVKEGAQIIINGRTSFATGSTIDILNDSLLEIGSCDTNIGMVLVCSNHIEMGNDVQIGRGVVIYDSNHHQTGLNKQIKLKPLKIGDHVWLCTGVTITKGVKIGSGSICGINATVMSNVKEHVMVMGNPAKTVMTDVEW